MESGVEKQRVKGGSSEVDTGRVVRGRHREGLQR